MAPITLGAVRVHFVYYETRAELASLLRRADVVDELESAADRSTIVLAIPATLRAILRWNAKGTPRPEIHGDVLVFQRPK